MQLSGYEVNKISDYLWEVPKQREMLVPGRIYTTQNMLEGTLRNDEAIKQVINVAHLPGIQKHDKRLTPKIQTRSLPVRVLLRPGVYP